MTSTLSSGHSARPALHHSGPLVLGLDVGGTKLAAGVVSFASAGDGLAGGVATVLASRTIPSRVEEGHEAMLERLIALGRAVLEDAGLRPGHGGGGGDAEARAGGESEGGGIAAVGIACGGPLDPERGIIQGAPHLPGWTDVPIASRMAAAFGRPAAVENDATAGALAEHRYGAGRGVDDLVYFTVSTGIGGGAISGGRLVRGATGNGSELGHLVVDSGGRACWCGRRGCLEAQASGSALAALARAAIVAGEPTSLASQEAGLGGGDITAETILEGVRAGDPLANRLWDGAMRALGAGVANAINAFDPAVVVLGGGLTQAGDLLFEPVRRIALASVLAPMAANVRIEPAGLGPNHGVVAAAAIAIERFGISIGADTRAALDEHVTAAEALRRLGPDIDAIGSLIAERLAAGARLIAFGNGGSAAEAQHLVAELVGHYRRDRPGLPAIALTADSAVVTAIGNDYAWQDVFARQVEAQARAGDVVVAISTSGGSENVIRGVRAAAANGAITIALTGGGGGQLAAEADWRLVMPARSTARIQELHAFVVHAWSEQIDRRHGEAGQ